MFAMKRMFLSLFAALSFVAASAQQQSVSDLELYAKSGNVEAMRKVGERYLHGDGVEKNEALGWQWLEKAAAGGDSEAKKIVGDRDAAQKQRAMGEGFMKGYKDQQVRSLAYDMLHDPSKGYSEAANKLRALALAGNAEAILFMYRQQQLPAKDCLTLGNALENGKNGLKKDFAWANKMYRMALYMAARNFGLTKEEKRLAADGVLRMFEKGYGIIDKYMNLKGLKTDADKGNAVDCQWMGYYYYLWSDFYHQYINNEAIAPGAEICIQYYQKAAELKNAEAMVVLGSIYEDYEPTNLLGGFYCDWMGLLQSTGYLENIRGRLNTSGMDKEEAERLKQQLMAPYKYYPRLTREQSGNLKAWLKAKSFPLYRDAAIAGNVDGMLLTARHYEKRLKYKDDFYKDGANGGIDDYEMARQWYAKAADKGSVTGAGSLRRIAVQRWEEADERAKDPDRKVLDYFYNIISNNDTTGIGRFLASYSLGRIFYDVNVKSKTYGAPTYDMCGQNALDFLREALTYPEKAKYPDVLSHAEYLIGNLAQAGEGDYYGFKDYNSAIDWYDKALKDYPQTNANSWRDEQYQTILKAKEECQNTLKNMSDVERESWEKMCVRAQAQRNAAAGLDMRLIENNYVWDYTKGPDPAGNTTWHPLADWEIDGVRWWKAHGFDPSKPMTRNDMVRSAYNKGRFAGEGRGYADYKNGLAYDPQKMCPTSSSQVMVGSEEEFRAYVKGFLDGYKKGYSTGKPF